MRICLCLGDGFLHLISPVRWKMHKFRHDFCCPEHQRPKGAISGGKWGVGKPKEKTLIYLLMCFGNNSHGCFDLVEMGSLED